VNVVSPNALLELEENTRALVPLAKAQALVESVYALDVSTWTDEDFKTLEHLIDRAVAVISAIPSSEHRPLIERLLVAREGVEQGMSPDPAKRPSLEEMRRFVAAHL
jgi:hypothetical protein